MTYNPDTLVHYQLTQAALGNEVDGYKPFITRDLIAAWHDLHLAILLGDYDQSPPG